MNILGQSSLIIAVVSFALGFSILSRNRRNKLFVIYAALCSIISCWAMFFFLETLWGEGIFYKFHLFFNIWLGPAALAFIRLLVRIQEDKFSRRLFDVSILVAVPLSAALLVDLDNYPWLLNVIYFFPVVVAIQLLELMWIDRRLKRGLKRLPKLPTVGLARRNLIYIGGLFVMSISGMDHIPEFGQVLPSFGNLALAAYLFFISKAISQQRLLNFEALFSKFLVLMAIALTLTGLYSVLVAWIQNSPGLFFLNSFIASFLILMLLEPLRTLVGYFTERLLTQKYRRLEQTLREAQMKLSGILDPGSLFQAVLLTIQQTLQPDRSSLFVLRSDGTKYRRVRALGPEPVIEPGSIPPLREILVNNSLMMHCERLHKKGELPILLDQIIESEMDRTASGVQREYLSMLLQNLKALGCNLLIPLIDSGKILGFATLYAPVPPEPWGSNWGLLQIFYPYFLQAAQLLRNMEVYVRQREKERLAMIGEMAAGLAHEIRNPLGAIKGAAQFLDPSVNKPESRFLQVIIDETDRLNKVVTQFLDYSRAQIPEFKLVDLAALTKKTIDFLRPGLREGLLLEFVGASEPATINASPEQMQQVILNLIQNSIKAVSEKPKGYIKVSTDVAGEGKQREVTLFIEDNGCGIKRENIDKIFIPFFTTTPSGTGLGLPICQKIIENHRGRIEVASEEGRFTRFTVTLPFGGGS